MKQTRTRLALVLAAFAAMGLLTASGPAGAAPSGTAPASVYCEYANHMPSVADR